MSGNNLTPIPTRTIEKLKAVSLDAALYYGPNGAGGVETKTVPLITSFIALASFRLSASFSFPVVTDLIVNANGNTVFDPASINNGSPLTLLIDKKNDPDNHIEVSSGAAKLNSNGWYTLSYSAFVERPDTTDNENRAHPLLRLQRSVDGGATWTNMDGTLQACYTRGNNANDTMGSQGSGRYGSVSVSSYPIQVSGLTVGQSELYRLVGFQTGAQPPVTDLSVTTINFSATISKVDDLSVSIADATTLNLASQAQAEAGSNNTNWMSPLRTSQSIAALQDYKQGIPNNKDLDLGTGSLLFGSGGGVSEFTEGDIRVHASSELEIGTDGGFIRLGDKDVVNNPNPMTLAETVATLDAFSGKTTLGKHSLGGLLNFSNTAVSGTADIWTDSDTVLRITNSGSASAGASLQLKSSTDSYLFSFEGRGGFRYFSRALGGEKFALSDTGNLKTYAGRIVKRTNDSTGVTLVKEDHYVKQNVSGISTKLDAAPVDGQLYKIANRSGGVCTLDGNGKLIAGNTGAPSATLSILNGETMECVYDASTAKWDIF